MADDSLVRLVRELEQRDKALAVSIAELAELEAAAQSLRARATEVKEFLEQLPDARRLAEDALAEARDELERRRDELRRAEEELAGEEARRRHNEEALAAARRAVVRTRDAVASAERKLQRAEETAAGLETAVQGAQAEVPRLEAEAGRLAERLGGLPRVSRTASDPGTGLAGVLDWAERAQSALFVARSGAETERERVVREANELGASVLGEPLVATSVALVRRRVEEAQASRAERSDAT